MAIIGGTSQTYQLKGLREDLTDMIWSVAPSETPFVTAVGRTTAKAVLHEWQTDTLRAPGANAQIEGDDVAAFDAVVPTVRLGNYTQILRSTLAISGTADEVDKAGRKTELAYQLLKKGKEIRLDVEFMCVGTNTAKAAGATGTARTSASVLSWLKTNTDEGATGVDPAAADGTGTRTPGTPRALAETQLKTVLQGIFTNSNEPAELGLMGAKQKQGMSTFTGNATRYVDAAPERLYAAVDRYVHDFGALVLKPDRVVRATDVLIINPDLWKLAWLRPIFIDELAKTGDAEKRMILGEVTLEARNEAGSGGIFDLT
jgi:hypothetical protein